MELLNIKRVLITQNSMRQVAGSEVVTLELLHYFASLDCKVTLYTHYLGNPIRKHVRSIKNVEVIVSLNEPELRFEDFDLVWIHQSIVPPSLIRQLSKSRKIPPVVFFHASSSVAIELPYLAHLEALLASKVLYVSNECHDQHRVYGIRTQADIFPNPAPKDFSTGNKQYHNKALENVLIVSNHPPVELSAACEILISRGIKVKMLGDTPSSKNLLLTSSMLRRYDAVISIGKTVQYCLAANIPIFIYDHFGGPGYLNQHNFEKAAYHNFSGRGFRRMSEQRIISCLMSGYQSAVNYQSEKTVNFQNKYSLENQLKCTLSSIKYKKIKSVSASEIDSFCLTQRIVKESVYNQNHAAELLSIKQAEFSRYTTAISQYRIIEETLRASIDELTKVIEERDHK